MSHSEHSHHGGKIMLCPENSCTLVTLRSALIIGNIDFDTIKMTTNIKKETY